MRLIPRNWRAETCPAAQGTMETHGANFSFQGTLSSTVVLVNYGWQFIVPILQMGEAKVCAYILAPSQLVV